MISSEWHALYTSPRAEKRVLKLLEAEGIECYLPLLRTPRVWSDRIKMVDLPLFNSYIFVKCKEKELFPLVKTKGVVRIVYYDYKPAIIREIEVETIRQFIKVAEGKRLCTGDEVEILVGSFKKVSGKIMKIQKKYIFLNIEQLSATVCVSSDKVAPIKRII